MASSVLYPPIVNSYQSAYLANITPENNNCKIYFSLSKFNGSADIGTVHASVVLQSTGMSVVKASDEGDHYRSTGIIINLTPVRVIEEDNLYYVEIPGTDLCLTKDGYVGWIPGNIYKVQIRLTTKDTIYKEDEGNTQSTWLENNASEFSEWSTICVIKATGKVNYVIPALGIDSTEEDKKELVTYSTSTLELSGHFDRTDKTELIYSYQFTLYNEDGVKIEESDLLYANQYQDSDSFYYLFKTELEDKKIYKLGFKYETINHYIGGFYQFDEEEGQYDDRIDFVVSITSINETECKLVVADNDTDNILVKNGVPLTTVFDEEEEGRIGLKIYDPIGNPFSGNLCIRRSDSSSNFKVWTDIKIVVFKQEMINDLPLIYDYTVESGVWYKYGIQEIDKTNTDIRGILKTISPIIRNFNYSFLLGKNDQQLKLMFDNTMGSYKHQMMESKIDPIGSKYPSITRNAVTNYKTFPINGLISFWMDENKLFTSKKKIYKYNDVVNLYNEYNKREPASPLSKEHYHDDLYDGDSPSYEVGLVDSNEDFNIENYEVQPQYDYIYERDFREEVLNFLYDGEFKLFKSPTEGNVIVRLMDINCVPNQSLDRMIYSFSANAFEMAEATMDNYLKYGFYNPGKAEKDFSTYLTYIGQIQFDDINEDKKIFEEINKKYGSNGMNLGGYTKEVQRIFGIKITFDGKPMKYKVNNQDLLGYKFLLGKKEFFIQSPFNTYEFDSRLMYTPMDELIIGRPEDNKNTLIPITIDFLYNVRTEIYHPKEIASITSKVLAGQLFKEFIPNENIYNDIYYKYFINYGNLTRVPNKISSIEIECNPGAVFGIKEGDDQSTQMHVVGATGQLRFYEISDIKDFYYVGMQVEDGNGNIIIDTTKKVDALINYIYTLAIITYK